MFFLISSTGVVYLIDESGSCSQVIQADGPIKKILYNEQRNILVVITQFLMLGQYSVGSDGKTTEITKVGISVVFFFSPWVEVI